MKFRFFRRRMPILEWIFTVQDKKYIFILFSFLAVLKLILVSNVEMGSGGSDAMEYARLARDFYWDTTNAWDLRRGPGVPLLVNFINLLGIPYRLGIEVLFIFTIFYLALISGSVFPPFIIMTASILAVFSPATYTEEILMSDIPFAIFFTLMVTSLTAHLLDIIKSTDLSLTRLLLSGLMAGYLCTIRDEGLLVYAVLILYAVFVFLLTVPIDYKKVFLCAGIPLISAYLFTLSISFANQTVHGFFAVNTRHGNITKLHKVLYKIKGGNVDNNDLTKAQFKRAAALSPEFDKILPFLLSKKEKLKKRWVKGAKSRLVNEIQRGFISLYYPTDSRGAEKMYAVCAEEIYKGLDKEELETVSIYPFGRSLISLKKWMELPGNFIKMVNISLNGFKYRFKEKKRAGLFNKILNRRTALIDNYNQNHTLNRIRTYLTDRYTYIEIYFFLLAGLGSFFSLRWYRDPDETRSFLPFLFILFAVCLRILTYAALDIFLNEQKARHIVNMNPLFINIIIISFFIIIFFGFYFFVKKKNVKTFQ